MGNISDTDLKSSEEELQNAKQFTEKEAGAKKDLGKQLSEAEEAKDLIELTEKIQNSDLFDDSRKELENRVQQAGRQMESELRDRIDQMTEDGFLDDEEKERFEDELDKANLEDLDRIQEEIEAKSTLFDEYERIREEVTPLVERWFEYFVERLPKHEEIELDNDSLSRKGEFDSKAAQKPINILLGTVKNLYQGSKSTLPKFLASIVVDVSGSMQGEKLTMARKLLIFYNELFSRIAREYGYIRYAVYTFSDGIERLKRYEEEYDGAARYEGSDGISMTVKARLMAAMRTRGGTNMLPAIQTAAEDLNTEVENTPDYASALYFFGDGEDTCGNAERIAQFLQLADAEQGFGEHLLSAIMLGSEDQRRELAAIFGEDQTSVAPDFETLIEEAMEKFDDQIEDYLANQTP